MSSEYTYYAGFELDFKKVTKQFSKKTYYEENYADKIAEYKKELNYNSDENQEESESEEEDDDFDNAVDNNKKIKIKNLNKIKKEHLFYYRISRRLSNEKKKYDCNIIIFDNELKEWLEDEEEIDLIQQNNLFCLDIDVLYTYINDFRIKFKSNEYANPKAKLFIDYLEQLFIKDYSKMNKMIESKMIDYDSLWYYFDKIKTYYVVKICEVELCFYYTNFYYNESSDEESKKLVLNGIITLINKEGSLYEGTISYPIKYFGGKKSLDSFEIKFATKDVLKEYKNRSVIIKNYMSKIQQMKLIGKQHFIVKNMMVSIEKDERIIVDRNNMKLSHLLPPEIKTYSSDEGKDIDQEILLIPFIPIFNLGCGKRWGLASYKDLHPIEFKENFFDEIVIDDDKKMIIKTLIENYDYKINNNVVEGKGQNLIFLLHGPPGVGKTLTAEAAADHLKKPLYHINIGDLDLNPENLEAGLNEIDKLCNQWNAILLMDEADIFLESRSFSDISRNTIVSIFLKFLEYSKNIIFLTTNRLDTLDVAIRSRINLIITYPKLVESNRLKIWTNCLTRFDIENKKKLLRKLSSTEVNGREIGNLLDIIFTILKSKNENFLEEQVKYDDFMDIFNKCMSINNESNLDKSSQLYL